MGLGVSNEVTDPGGVVSITVSSGVLTVFDVPQPDPTSDTTTDSSREEN